MKTTVIIVTFIFSLCNLNSNSQPEQGTYMLGGNANTGYTFESGSNTFNISLAPNLGYFFTDNLAGCVGRVVGRYRAVGGGIRLCLCEDGVESGQIDLPDTNGEWTLMQWTASARAPAAGLHEYCLKGQRIGATSAFVRRASVSLLELIQNFT